MNTAEFSSHLAGIIPIAGQPLDYNMPWADCLMPLNQDYHAIERAVHTAASAGCNTIWIVSHKETQPLLRKKIGEWVYDPESIWKPPNVFFNKVEIPIYYIAINPKDRGRRDSLAWSALYGAKISSYVSMKISKWLIPEKFFIVSPFGIVSDETIKKIRPLLRQKNNIIISHNNKTFLDNIHSPFSFMQHELDVCLKYFKETYTGNETKKTFQDIFKPVDITGYEKIEASWFFNIDNWEGYRKFIASNQNVLCKRPKHMVTHEWWGFIKDR